ncbi:Gfo/Idh/MocA family oxidoreductase [Brevundimonas sp.]|uniref:Gfo/Idh/MocA family oxidoreductase n=1 Tax=Brevundimonas sp. TaxID=1871086 RepID=UPI0025C44178|nr:Gfo/Idh/MocA family oxidoreductase [Brevundimonas sp.]
MRERVWLVGAGRMGLSYAKVLTTLGTPFIVIGRGDASARAFKQETGVECRPGGVAAALKAADAPSSAIVAIDIPELEAVAEQLMHANCRHILLEKPGGTDEATLARISAMALETGTDIRVAYNRRFYESVRQARAGLQEDGGAVSMTFSFTESADAIVKIGYPQEVLDNWLLANSTHVIDTAFHLAGEPREWTPRVYGSLSWHPSAARFQGGGMTRDGVMFSYSADWDAPGGWAVEIASRTRRFILKPMERLAVQQRGSFAMEFPESADATDGHKPGLLRMTRAFLTGEDAADLPDIHDHLSRTRAIYGPMAGKPPAA